MRIDRYYLFKYSATSFINWTGKLALIVELVYLHGSIMCSVMSGFEARDEIFLDFSVKN